MENPSTVVSVQSAIPTWFAVQKSGAKESACSKAWGLPKNRCLPTSGPLKVPHLMRVFSKITLRKGDTT